MHSERQTDQAIFFSATNNKQQSTKYIQQREIGRSYGVDEEQNKKRYRVLVTPKERARAQSKLVGLC